MKVERTRQLSSARTSKHSMAITVSTAFTRANYHSLLLCLFRFTCFASDSMVGGVYFSCIRQGPNCVRVERANLDEAHVVFLPFGRSNIAFWSGATNKNAATVLSLAECPRAFVYAKSIMHEMITRNAIFLDRVALMCICTHFSLANAQ